MGRVGLREYLGEDAANALLRWQDITGNRVDVPSDAWQARGYTDAMVASLLVRPVGRSPLGLVAKIVPAGLRGEGGRHRRAWQDAPARFRDDHLVRLLFDATPTESGRVILFQELAGGTRRCRPAALLPPGALAECGASVAHHLLTGWNPGYDVIAMPVTEFCHRELAEPFSGSGSPGEWRDLGVGAPWITTPEDDHPLPNPVALAHGHPAVGDRRIDVLCGRGHGDLHLENLLVRQDDNGVDPDSFRLIDLSGYRPAAPLVRDQANLLLSVVMAFRDRLAGPQRESLLTDLVRDRPVDAEQNPLLARTITSIRRCGARFADSLSDAWRRQFVLAMMGAALRFTTFQNLGAPTRWWCFRLAAHAAAEYFRMEELSDVDVCPAQVTSPFQDGVTPTAAPPPAEPLRLHGPFVGGSADPIRH